MLKTKPRQISFAFKLERRLALRVWEQAVRSSAVLTLTPRTDEDMQLFGPIETGTPESLWITVSGTRVNPNTPLQSVCCEGVLELGDARYLFETNILAVREEDGRTSVEIARPEGLQVIQRRRFWRAKLRESAPVRLSRSSNMGSRKQAEWSCPASMMNVSLDGLACRTDRTCADAVGVGEVVRLSFSVSSSEEPFELDAVMKSKIPAGTEGQTVLGLQFRHADGEQYRRLQAALERCG